MNERRRDLGWWLDAIPRGAARALIARDPDAAESILRELAREAGKKIAPLDDWLEPPLPAEVVFVSRLDGEERCAELIAFTARANRLARDLVVRVVMIFHAAAIQRCEAAESLYGAFWLDGELVAGEPHPNSPGEHLLASAIERDAELAPLFEPNQPVLIAAGREIFVDLIWRTGSLIVEIDGWATHGTRAAFARDRQRDYELILAGYTVLRLTHAEVVTDPDLALSKIRALVQARKNKPPR